MGLAFPGWVQASEGCQTGRVWEVPAGARGAPGETFVTATNGPPVAPTRATVKWDDSALTVIFDAVDHEVVAQRAGRDDPDLWRDDSVEIFLDIGHAHNPTASPWVHILAGVGGGLSDLKGGAPWYAQWGGDSRFQMDGLTSRVERTADGWTITVIIPWQGLGRRPQPGEVWGFNVNRGNQPEGEYTGWAPTRAGFDSVQEWGHLIFAPPEGTDFRAGLDAARAELARRHAALPRWEWKAGTARVDLTPTAPMWLAGYGGRDRPAEGTNSRLWAKVLALQDADGRRAVLVTFDLIGMERSLSQSLCARLEQKFGLRRDQVALCFSHTHSGPVVGRNLHPIHFDRLPAEAQAQIHSYADRLVERVDGAVGEALGALAPARLSEGAGLATFGVNRRLNREGEVPKRRAAGQLLGPVDPEVPVLAVRTPSGRLQAVVFGYACHATVLGGYSWDADYPGYAQAELESRYPGVTALFWAGCGADVNPLPRRQVELAQGYGGQLAAAVDTVLGGLMRPIPARIETRYRDIELPFAPRPTMEQLQRNSESTDAVVAAEARRHRASLEAGQPLPATYPYPVQRWALGGEVIWHFLGGEAVVDYALRIRGNAGGQRVWVAAFANDVMGYVPSEGVLSEGGYEGGGAAVYYGLPAAWAPGIEGRILAEVEAP